MNYIRINTSLVCLLLVLSLTTVFQNRAYPSRCFHEDEILTVVLLEFVFGQKIWGLQCDKLHNNNVYSNSIEQVQSTHRKIIEEWLEPLQQIAAKRGLTVGQFIDERKKLAAPSIKTMLTLIDKNTCIRGLPQIQKQKEKWDNYLAALIVAYQMALKSYPRCGKEQDIDYPGKPVYKQYKSSEYGVAIKFPKHWDLLESLRNEIWLATGTIRNETGFCFVRMTQVEYLEYSTIEEWLQVHDKNNFLDMFSDVIPELKVNRFDTAYLGGRKARRIIYSGIDESIKTKTVTYQTLDGNRIYTVSCASEITDFHMLYNDFEVVISSFLFTR